MCEHLVDVLSPAANSGGDAEPPRVPARPPGGHSVRVQPHHSGPGRGHARQPDELHGIPAAARHEDLPRPPAGAGAEPLTPLLLDFSQYLIVM